MPKQLPPPAMMNVVVERDEEGNLRLVQREPLPTELREILEREAA